MVAMSSDSQLRIMSTLDFFGLNFGRTVRLILAKLDLVYIQ
jgi:hypothetical protein